MDSQSYGANVAGHLLQDDTLIPISIDTPSSPTLQSPVVETSTSTVTSIPSSYKALEHHQQSVQTNATTFSYSTDPSDLTLFLTTGEGTVKIVSYPSLETLHTLHSHTSSCLSVAMSPTARYLATGGNDSLISLWNTNDWICQRTLSSANGGAVRGVSWSWDGRFIVGACDEPGCGGTGLDIFHAETGDIVYNIPTGSSNVGVPAAEWHPSRYWLAYSVTSEGMGSSGTAGLRIVGAGGGNL